MPVCGLTEAAVVRARDELVAEDLVAYLAPLVRYLATKASICARYGSMVLSLPPDLGGGRGGVNSVSALATVFVQPSEDCRKGRAGGILGLTGGRRTRN